MADITNTQPLQTQQDDNSGISTQKEIDALNRSLGLIIPEGVLTEMILTWNKFFYLLRKMLDLGNIQDSQISGLLATFESVPDNQKNDRMNLLSEQFNIFSRENEFIKELWYVDELSAEYDDFMARFPEEVRDRYNIYLQTGEDVGDVKELIQAQLELQSADQRQRLNTVLDKRAGGFRVDSSDQRGTYALSQRNGIILNEDELEERFAGQEETGNVPATITGANFGSNGGSNVNPNPNINQPQPYKKPAAPVRPPLESGNPNNGQYVTAPRQHQQQNPQNAPQQQYRPSESSSNQRQYQNQPQNPNPNPNFRPNPAPGQRQAMPHPAPQASPQYKNQNKPVGNNPGPSTIQAPGMRPKPIANLDDLLNNKK